MVPNKLLDIYLERIKYGDKVSLENLYNLTKDIKYDIVQKETGTEFFCSNHKRYFKTKMAFDNHYRATHKFKCNICGLFLGFKKKLDKHISNIHKNNKGKY